MLALRAWYVTLGDSLVNGTAVPPPEQRDPAARKRLLHCTREAISRGQPMESRNALLVLWASEHLDMLWRLEGRLGRTQDSGPEADDRPAEAPAASPRGVIPEVLSATKTVPGPCPAPGVSCPGQLGRTVRSRIVTSRLRRLASMSTGYSVPMSVST